MYDTASNISVKKTSGPRTGRMCRKILFTIHLKKSNAAYWLISCEEQRLSHSLLVFGRFAMIYLVDAKFFESTTGVWNYRPASSEIERVLKVLNRC